MTTQFQIAAGSVTGREHYRLHSNCQDAYRIVQQGEVTVAIVCDGCGDPASKHSEVGANIGARMIAQKLAALFLREPDRLATIENTERTLEQVRRETLATLKKLSRTLSSDPIEAISTCLLFTVVGCAITPDYAAFFSLGDGMLIINGQTTQIGPYPDNAPPYMAYALLPDCSKQTDLHFTLHSHMPTHDLHTFLIGSDGVQDLVSAAPQLCALWEDPIHYTNPYAMSNKLRLLNTEQTQINWQERKKTIQRAILPDDTTLIVGRHASLLTHYV